MYKYLRVKNKIKVLNFHQVNVGFDMSRICKTTTEKLHLVKKNIYIYIIFVCSEVKKRVMVKEAEQVVGKYRLTSQCDVRQVSSPPANFHSLL